MLGFCVLITFVFLNPTATCFQYIERKEMVYWLNGICSFQPPTLSPSLLIHFPVHSPRFWAFFRSDEFPADWTDFWRHLPAKPRGLENRHYVNQWLINGGQNLGGNFSICSCIGWVLGFRAKIPSLFDIKKFIFIFIISFIDYNHFYNQVGTCHQFLFNNQFTLWKDKGNMIAWNQEFKGIR